MFPKSLMRLFPGVAQLSARCRQLGYGAGQHHFTKSFPGICREKESLARAGPLSLGMEHFQVKGLDARIRTAWRHNYSCFLGRFQLMPVPGGRRKPPTQGRKLKI